MKTLTDLLPAQRRGFL